MTDIVLQLSGLVKSFGDTRVLDGIDLSVKRGEFVTLLGASGCGKTTTLRIIAGLEDPDEGRVFISGKDVTSLEPDKRNVNMVFQNYALFPHMNVEQNIGYSLKLKRKDKAHISKAVEEALELVQLEGYGKRMPKELSGGQQQRVAMARAIVNKPALLLLDEPLGALDLQLRRKMQTELKKLQKMLGVTFVYITHDQEEALNMSDRVAVMRNGTFEQVGTPSQVYDLPKTAYVASFVGTANLVSGIAGRVCGDFVRIENESGSGFVPLRGQKVYEGKKVTVALRREVVKLAAPEETRQDGLYAVVTDKVFAGGVLQVTCMLQDGSLIVSSRQGMDLPFAPGDEVVATWKPGSAVLVEDEEQHTPLHRDFLDPTAKTERRAG